MAVVYSPNAIIEDLVLCLDAANPKSYPGSGTTWFDISGKGNHFTLFNSPTFVNSSFLFDGTNQYARSTSFLDLSDYLAITVEIGLKDNNPNILTMTFEHSANWNANTSGFGLVLNSNGSTVVPNSHHTNHREGSGAVNYDGYSGTDNVIHTNIWSRISDSSGRAAYINATLRGLLSGSAATTSSPSFRNDFFYISSRGGASLFSNNTVYYIKIYGKKLTNNEVKQNVSVIKSRLGI